MNLKEMRQEVNYNLEQTVRYSPPPEIESNRQYRIREKGRKNEAVRRSRPCKWRSGK